MSQKIATREGFGNEIVEIGKTNKDVFVLSADLEDATKGEYFKFAHPDRFMNVGIAEQDLVGMAAGMSYFGYIPFICSFAVFLTNRAYDMIRLDLCYNNTNVKVVCSHAGVTVGEDGASAQCLEDFAIMRVLPNMQVVCPMDDIEARKATRAFTKHVGPQYMRTSRAGLPVLTTDETPFEIGKANTMKDGNDVSIIACGVMVSEAIDAAKILEEKGIDARVINMHTIKPIDREAIIAAANETGAIVTAEEHQIHGGLGGAVTEVLAQEAPVPVEMVAVQDSFGQTGNPEQLLEFYGLKASNIVEAAEKVIARKKS